MEKQVSARTGTSSILELPIEMIGNILSYLTSEDGFFWCYGLVCKCFLREVAKIMKDGGIHIKLPGDEWFEYCIELISINNYVAYAVAEVGLDLSNNRLLNVEHLSVISYRSKGLKAIQLGFCDLTQQSFTYLAKLSSIQYLDLAGCGMLNDKHLTLIAKGCTNLTHLILLMCEKISDLGKYKYFFDQVIIQKAIKIW